MVAAPSKPWSRAPLRLVAVALLLVAVSLAEVPPPTDLSSYYTAPNAPISVLRYLNALVGCEGEFALCSYATCVIIPNSNPPVAECGCYAFTGKSLGAGPGILNAQVKDATLQQCGSGLRCLTDLYNKSTMCDKMNSKTLFPGYPLTSTYNPDFWTAATGQTEAPPKLCRGGTATNCYSAACRRGAPTSQFLPPGTPEYNATCYCRYFTTRKKQFLMGSSNVSCGPTKPAHVKPNTLIYNGL